MQPCCRETKQATNPDREPAGAPEAATMSKQVQYTAFLAIMWPRICGAWNEVRVRW